MDRLFSSITLTVIALCAVTAEGAGFKISVEPKSVGQGGVALVRVRAPAGTSLPAELSARAEEQPLRLFACADRPEDRCALIAIAADARPGRLEVSATAVGEGKPAIAHVKIRKTPFKVSKLKVDPGITSPSAEDKVRIAKEREEVSAIYASGSATALWDGRFDLPGTGEITSRFGNRRSFNGVTKSVHQGTDLHAVLGTPVLAANAGRVALAKNMFYAGNMVILDHGSGVFTLYAHLSEFAVQPGQTVKRGDLLGKAGATGRVTAAHLHWGSRVNNVLVDPLELKKAFNRMWGNRDASAKTFSSRGPNRG